MAHIRRQANEPRDTDTRRVKLLVEEGEGTSVSVRDGVGDSDGDSEAVEDKDALWLRDTATVRTLSVILYKETNRIGYILVCYLGRIFIFKRSSIHKNV